MTEINIADFFHYDKDSIMKFLQIIKDKKFKIIIPRNSIKVQPAVLIGMVEYDLAAHTGHLLSKISRSFSYYVPCSFTRDPFHFIVTIRSIKALSELLYSVTQVLNPLTPGSVLIHQVMLDASAFSEKTNNGEVTGHAYGLTSVANELQEHGDEYCVLKVNARATLDTNDCSKYSNAGLYVHLLKQNTNEFEIIIPKKINMELLAFDFVKAAYAGHLLSEIVSGFAYFVPAPRSDQSFYFHVTVHDFEKFADTLYLIIRGFDDSSDYCEEIDIKASEFIVYVDETGRDCKTCGLMQLAMELFSCL